MPEPSLTCPVCQHQLTVRISVCEVSEGQHTHHLAYTDTGREARHRQHDTPQSATQAPEGQSAGEGDSHSDA